MINIIHIIKETNTLSVYFAHMLIVTWEILKRWCQIGNVKIWQRSLFKKWNENYLKGVRAQIKTFLANHKQVAATLSCTV